MIISERQIMQLISLAHMQRGDLLQLKMIEQISPNGMKLLEDISLVLKNITNQQSEELKAVE